MTGYNTQVPEYAYDPCGNNHESSEVNVVGQELNAYMAEDDQPPTASTQMLYNRLGASSEPIWPSSNESKLSVVSELIHLKAQYQIPNACYDDLCWIMQRLMPEDIVMPKNIYETKKLVHDMGLPVQKIHCCRNGCMIHWGCDSELSESGRTACPYCMEESEAFTLQHGGKQSWFDNHRKFLPHNHHFRRNTTASRKGKKVLNNHPPIKSGREILNEIDYWGFLKVANTSSAQLMPNSYEEHPDILSIFAQHKAEMIGKWNERYLSDEEIVAAHTYILLNCTEVEPFIEMYRTYRRYCQPHLSDAQIDATLDAEFSKWFNRFVSVQKSIQNIRPLVEVNEKKRYSGNDIFVLATQATQVYYVNYPSLRRDKKDWLAVIKIKARAIVDIPVSNNVESESTSDPYQDDEPESQPIQIVTNDEPELLIDDSATQLNIVDVEVEDDSDEDEIQNEYFDLTKMISSISFAIGRGFRPTAPYSPFTGTHSPVDARSEVPHDTDTDTVSETIPETVQTTSHDGSISQTAYTASYVSSTTPLANSSVAPSGAIVDLHGRVQEHRTGEPVGVFPLYKFTHTSKDDKDNGWFSDNHGEFVNKYLQTIAATQEAASADESSSASVDPNKIFLELSGGVSSKGRVFGVGSAAPIYYNTSQTSGFYPPVHHPPLYPGFSGMQPTMHPTTSMPLRPQVTYPPRGSTSFAPFVHPPINEEEAYYPIPPSPQQGFLSSEECDPLNTLAKDK
ncbi:hypothetical protein V6N11_080951 [Hibiscus sabdariffa]|uniref:DUF4216 domain-containing protein n=1 Tax=Hibiscus sabdariffa TaxID=183260 RepID=A0ABR2QID8_9ROSI